MTYEAFQQSLSLDTPPAGLSPLLTALWHDGKDDWESAHEIAQSAEGTPAYDRIHAYLHRKEGDQWNAGYWYRRAGASMPSGSLDKEWESLVRHHLSLLS
ncbi:hypothetical protein [Siphonobacter sp. SORGH_AS_1065]|uniref:hypothetical protein n=1 Tax=Siphonobacter sp. SORGH_AS_1065 TaxID=3041795 RepID=UPI002780C4F1|nr:hypothetical protein [Siphonobacter sp. SORGH_AS_1065]MDQ1086292.1 hypothetical protein [Siphonobacter sp. SORGH_AS_1065]